ncbi:MAG: hypothetical protein HYX42_19945 [Polaromonas sp.]|uniref:hypothetical protein n=1 Tax=Polaromonas sp. TaxID=1869339 RepID=UPI0025FD30C5|nr:hypothetical protein [Polaromonas sp.]MBI2728516.1 hypothetical protein [Polaromonas sp.]
MSKNSVAKTATKKRLTPSTKRRQALKDVIASRTVQLAISGRNPKFVFPKMSGAAAAELMKAAGILTPDGKLTKPYR